MPMIIPALAVGGAAAAGGTAAVGGVAGLIGITSVTTGAIVNAAVGTALVVGASYAVAKLSAPRAPKPSSQSFEFKQPLPVRFFTYGAPKVSGPVVLLEVLDDAPHTLFKIVVFGTRELGSIQRLYVDGGWAEDADLVSNPAIAPSEFTFNAESAAYLYLGTDDQLRSTAITWPGWTDAHRLRGIPYVAGYFGPGNAEDFNENYPGGGPPEFAMVGGVKVYDPRKDGGSTAGVPNVPTIAGYPAPSGSHRRTDKSTWEYADNQRLCVLDWITWPEGYGKSWDRIDWASWIPQIYLADENVPLRAGGTEKRYRVATQVSYDEPRSRVLHRLLEAGDQQLFKTPAGLIGSRGGVWQAPGVSLAVERFPEASFTHGVPTMDRINEFQLTCMLPSKDYTEFDLEPWVNAADPDHAAGIIRRAPLELNQVPSNGQAQRLAKIYMSKRNPKWAGQVRTNFAGLNAIGQSAVNLSFDELDQPADTFNGAFWINGQVSFLPEKTGLTFPVASADATAYDWDAVTEEKYVPGEDPLVAPPVVSGSLTVGSVLSCTTGTWNNSPTGYTYQWRRAGVNISGATASTHTVVVGDVGAMLSCVVTALPTGSGTALSNEIGPIPAAIPVNTALPVISGTTEVGQTLTTTTGTWTFSPTSYAYQWKKGGVAISGATANSYVLVSGDVGGTITVTVTATNVDGSGNATSAGVGPVTVQVGGAALLVDETDGFATDFIYLVDAQRVALKVAGAVTSYGLDSFYATAGGSPKLVYDVAGNLVWSPHNMFLNSAAPVTQSVTTVAGYTYTVTIVGSGSMTGSAGASGVATAASPLTFVATTTPSTFTKAGTVTRIQMNRGSVATAYLATTAVVRNGLAVDYHPTTHAVLGLLTEPAATNLLLNNAALSTQSVTVTAVAYTLSFFGTGTVTLSGVSTAGPLTGTGVGNRVSLTFTPTAGSLTLTVTGSVTNAQLETGTVPTSVIPTFGATATRAVDGVNLTPASINYSATAGSWWLEMFQLSNPGTPRYVQSAAGAAILAGSGTNGVLNFDGSTISKTVVTALIGNIIKAEVAWDAAGHAITGQGLAPSTNAVAPGASMTTPGAAIYIGGSGGNISHGYIHKLTYRARRVSNANMATETA